MKKKELSHQQIRSEIRKLDLLVARGEARAMQHRASARRQLAAIVKDLMPTAAGLARRGKGRLLAVLARILQDEKLDHRSAAIIKKLSRD
jgi:hypothetical protein